MAAVALRKPSSASAPYWGMLKRLSKPVKIELVALLSESVAFEDKAADEPELTEEEKDRLFESLAGSWANRDSEMLDSALARFSGDFGGSKDAEEFARELRQGRDVVRDVETW